MAGCILGYGLALQARTSNYNPNNYAGKLSSSSRLRILPSTTHSRPRRSTPSYSIGVPSENISVAFTFGCLGDIIAVVFGKALGESTGSAKEYQDLRKDLDGFARILKHVCIHVVFQSLCICNNQSQILELWQDRLPTLEMIELEHSAKTIVDECTVLIHEAMGKPFHRYDKALKKNRQDASAKLINMLVGGYRKIEWKVRDKKGSLISKTS